MARNWTLPLQYKLSTMILENKYYEEKSVFKPENLLREARRQKQLPEGHVPAICLLDPDGDILDYLLRYWWRNNCLYQAAKRY